MLKIGVKIDEVRIDGDLKKLANGGMFMMELRSRYFGHIKESMENLDKWIASVLPAVLLQGQASEYDKNNSLH